MSTSSVSDHRTRAWVTPLCWTAILLDGFDVVVLGTVIPVLLRDKVWGLTPVGATVASSLGLVGLMIGGLALGTITDLVGRRKVLIFAVTLFSLFTALCAIAPSLELFVVFRFIAGLGLGGCLPTAIILTSENAREGRWNSSTTFLITGYHVGAVLTALLGILIIPSFGWRAMFVVGALPALIVVPLMLKYLPESPSFLAAVTRQDGGEVRPSVREVIGGLFRHGWARVTVAFWVASSMGLLLVYGLNTWLPEIMRQAGYPLGAALALLLTLNVGAIIGLLIAGRVADRRGIRPSVIAWFGAGAVFLALLSVRMPVVALYGAVLLAGLFVFSAQVLLYAYVGQRYPVQSRATALGWTAGIGRIGGIAGPLLGGALVTAGIAYPWGFYAFAVVAAIGAVAVAAVGTAAVGTAATAKPVDANS